MAYPSNDPPSDETYRVVSDELRAFIERVELLEAEKSDLATDIREVYAEAKGRGYDVKVVRRIIVDRRKDKVEMDEFEAVLELYRDALGDV